MAASSFCASSRSVKCSPIVRNRLLSALCAMRQPKWLPLDSGPSWRKITFTSSSLPSSASVARAIAVRAPPPRARRSRNRSSCSARNRGRARRRAVRPGRTQRPSARLAAAPTACRPASTIRMRPGRSVTSMRPSGRKASAQGCDSPPATVSTLRSPADDLKVCALRRGRQQRRAMASGERDRCDACARSANGAMRTILVMKFAAVSGQRVAISV